MTVHAARPYQADLKARIYEAWRAGNRNVLAVMPCGAGKSFVAASIVSETNGAVCVIVHRGELMTQLSLALAREGVRHRIIGSTNVRRACTQEQLAALGRDYVTHNARVAVASVDTLVRMDPKDPWFQQVVLWVGDEAHHFSYTDPKTPNKWARSSLLMPNALGLGFTATPERADGKGLGADADGVFHAMVLGPSGRDMVSGVLGQKYLADYRVIAKPSAIDLSNVTTAADGDYSRPKLSVARAASSITGDCVQHYQRFTPGKQGITFDVDVAAATATAAAFRSAGVSAEVVHGDTPDDVRRAIIQRYRTRDLLQMVNVDLFGEGFDVPRCQVASFNRPTQSFPTFAQQFGRPCRLDPDDPDKVAVIIDHVGNVMRHGLPDAYREVSLDRRERRSRSAPSDVVPTRTCLNEACCSVFERFLKACPFCGTEIVIMDRSRPEFVDGDLVELDPEVLAKLRGDVARVDGPVLYPTDLSIEARMALNKHHMKRQVEQSNLRSVMALWAGWQSHMGRELSEQYVRFFHRYGLDVATAMALKTRDAEALRARIQADLDKHGVVST